MSDLFLFESSYLKKVVEWFKMFDVKIINEPLRHHTKILIMQYSQSEYEKKEIESTTYASEV